MVAHTTAVRSPPVWRRFIIPALTTAIMLAILLGLGTWQVYRLHWKEGILARLAAAEADPPKPLTGTPSPYEKVSVTGRFLYDHAAWFGAEVRDAATGPQMGYFQIVPLQRDGAPTVLVDRGWVPDSPLAHIDEPGGQVTVVGYVRGPQSVSWFSAPDDATNRHFYTMSPGNIAAAVGVPNPAPFVLVALGPDTPETYPDPAQHLPQPPNNHLSYAITWYGLAAALVVMFAAWVRKTVRDSAWSSEAERRKT